MKAELILFDPTNKEYNRMELAVGVAGVRCIWVGPSIGDGKLIHNFIAIDACRAVLPAGHRMRGVEMYENGRSNVYVVPNTGDTAIGFIRVTPEPETHNSYTYPYMGERGQTPLSNEDKAVYPILNRCYLAGKQLAHIEELVREAYQAGVKSWIM